MVRIHPLNHAKIAWPLQTSAGLIGSLGLVLSSASSTRKISTAMFGQRGGEKDGVSICGNTRIRS